MSSHTLSPLSQNGFMPHGMGYLWRTDLLFLHVISDALTALAYASISITLLYFVRRRRDLAFHWIFVCFAIFIIACGMTHAMEIWVIWQPNYWLSGWIKAITALASVPTAILLIRLVPAALAVPSPAVLRRAYADLQREVAQRRQAEQDLIAASQRLSSEAARPRLAAIVESSEHAILRMDNGGVLASMIVRDIAERKRAEEALLESARILDLAQVLVREPGGRILRWNHGAEELYGYTAAEATGRISHDLLQTRFSEPLIDIEARLERTGSWQGELSHTTRDGREIEVASVWVMERDAQGAPRRIMESNTDITEPGRAEQRAAAQLARLKLLHVITRAIGEHQDLHSIVQIVVGTLEDQMPIDFGCLCLHQPPGVLVVAGVGAKSMDSATAMRLTEQSVVPIDQNGLARCVGGQTVYEPDLSAVPFAFPQRLFKGGFRSMVCTPLLVEGKAFAVLIVARHRPGSFSCADCEFVRQLSDHVALAARQTQLHANLQAAYEDLRQTQQAVVRHEKLRVLGQMASGIAHDINNALSPASLYVEALIERAPAPSEIRDSLLIIQRAIEGVAQTIARMKEFYAQGDPQLNHTPVSLNRLAAEVVDLTRARWSEPPQESGGMISVETRLAADLPDIYGNEGEIRDALINLIMNAVDAMPQGGVLTLRSGFPGTDRVQFEVTDTGIGMDEATRSRCLELFFSTKGARGTGLGLAMVYGTMERHGGELQIESAPELGTTIRLLFPIVTPTGEIRDALRSPAAVQHPLSVLVVDDDPIILSAMRAALERDRHHVKTADGGQAGIDACSAAKRRGEPFDVVITDLGMPNVDGRMVAAAIRALDPRTKVILLTGWGHRLIAENELPSNVDRVLEKPAKLSSLRAAIGELSMAPKDLRVV
jgi:PAS domain S-box-containing protein